MSPQIERRRSDRRSTDEELAPEYLALLEVCGGDIRASDRVVLAERHPGAPAAQVGSPDDRGADGREAALSAPDRRRAGPA
ncbi:MAG TPA: hypothetical protein VGO85_03890 [Caldimonas sp.]|jgi:hypothetical protein|nr:hypothetical protein [Caldimonas sp.]